MKQPFGAPSRPILFELDATACQATICLLTEMFTGDRAHKAAMLLFADSPHGVGGG
jgi:hypothetical protein